jgi:hypothetical protein
MLLINILGLSSGYKKSKTDGLVWGMRFSPNVKKKNPLLLREKKAQNTYL